MTKRKYEMKEIFQKINQKLVKKKGAATLFVCSKTMSIRIAKANIAFAEKIINEYDLETMSKTDRGVCVSFLVR